MNNGCICCTVRGDLIQILHKLLQRTDPLDAIIIETTGLADPAPVAQTFFVDEYLQVCTMDESANALTMYAGYVPISIHFSCIVDQDKTGWYHYGRWCEAYYSALGWGEGWGSRKWVCGADCIRRPHHSQQAGSCISRRGDCCEEAHQGHQWPGINLWNNALTSASRRDSEHTSIWIGQDHGYGSRVFESRPGTSAWWIRPKCGNRVRRRVRHR